MVTLKGSSGVNSCVDIQNYKYSSLFRFLPGLCPEVPGLCEGEGEVQSLAGLCGSCWVPGLVAAAGADPGLPHPSEEEELLAGGRQLQSGVLV